MAAVGKSSGPNCLLCTELISGRNGKTVDKDKSQEAPKFLFGGNSTTNDLKNQLSVFFLLRKVLSLPQDFLETLLTQCGSPAEWSIQLCRQCTRLFKEAEYLWDRLKQLQTDFDKVSNEIKDVISKSIGPDEEKNKNGVTKKSLVGSKLKPSQISDCVRKTFFLNSTNTKLAIKDASNTKSESFVSNISIDKSSQSELLKWNEKGVPYLALVDFENKMKKLVESVIVTQTSQSQAIVPVPVKDQKPLKEASTQTLDVPRQSSPTEFISVENNDNDNEMEFELEGEDPLVIGDVDPINNISNSTSTNAAINIPTLPIPIIAPQPVVPTEPASAIRIVQTSTLMEPEEDDNDNDAAPHIIGILKHDPDAVATIDLDSGDSLPDPLAINDDDDPDYVPDSPAVSNIKPSSTNGNENKSEKKPEEQPSKFTSISIQPIKLQTNVYECSKCKETFDARVGCQSHILRDHYEDRQPFHCHVCSAKYSLFPKLKEHVRNLHGGITTPYDNDFNPVTDNISFELSKILNGPTEEPNPTYRTGIPVYDCPLCTQKFTVKRNVVRHAKTVHKTTIPLAQVGLTKKSGTGDGDPLSLDNDAPTNHTFSCIECEQRNITFTATTPEALEFHRKRLHMGNNGSNSIRKKIKVNVIRKPPERKQSMSCPDCKKILPTVTAMAEHLKHPENKCKQCSRHFLFDMDLKRHVEMEHTRGACFQCPYCPKSFSAQIIYEKHIDNHQLHDVHECEFCQTKFTGFANLHRHMEIHANLIEQQQQQLQQDPLACE